MAYCSAGDLGRLRGADRPLPYLPGRPLGQRCPWLLPDRWSLVGSCHRCVSSTQRTRCAADAKGTRTHEEKEDIALISDKRMVRQSECIRLWPFSRSSPGRTLWTHRRAAFSPCCRRAPAVHRGCLAQVGTEASRSIPVRRVAHSTISKSFTPLQRFSLRTLIML